LYGDPSSPRIAILCAGYCDDHEAFQSFASRLSKEAACLAGVTCLPGYDDREDRPYLANKEAGYSFDEMVGSMREAVKVLRKESTFGGGDGVDRAKLIGIFHDWGVAPGTIYTNRSIEEGAEDLIPDNVVLFDVMGPPHPGTKDMPADRKDTFYEKFVTIAYRAVFACAFGVRRYFSKFLAKCVFLSGMITLEVFHLSPTLKIDGEVFEQRHKKPTLDRFIYTAYPYYNMFGAMFSSRWKSALGEMSLPMDLTRTPVLYMYGTEKRINFHDRRALAVLEREQKGGKKSRAMAVEKAGHFLYIQQEDICLEEVVKFITDA